MKKILGLLAFLLICGNVSAEDKVEVQKKVIVEKVKVVPKVGVKVPLVKPLPGKYYWKHPTYGWGNWYYPAPAVAVPADYYLDEYGRVVPNGYVYDPDGNLVPLQLIQAPTPYYYYPYRYHNGRWRWVPYR